LKTTLEQTQILFAFAQGFHYLCGMMKTLARYLLLLSLALTLCTMSACGDDSIPKNNEEEPPTPPPDDDDGDDDDDNPPLVAGWAELPVVTSSEGMYHVTHWVSADGNSAAKADTPQRVRNYTVAYSSEKLQPLWVAYPMHAWYNGSVGRSEDWFVNPEIPADKQPNLYRSYNQNAPDGAFSRGHMVASDCRQRSRAMNDQTFYYTNSAPQTQNAFNGGIWLKLETLEKSWGFSAGADTLYVVTGSHFADTPKKVTTDRDGKVIPVPTHFYKAFLTTKGTGAGKHISQCKADELKCVVFFLEHFGHANNAQPTTNHMMSVDDLETTLGMDFFPMIADDAESVEASFDVADWAGVAQN
jgi:endonuclease G